MRIETRGETRQRSGSATRLPPERLEERSAQLEDPLGGPEPGLLVEGAERAGLGRSKVRAELVDPGRHVRASAGCVYAIQCARGHRILHAARFRRSVSSPRCVEEAERLAVDVEVLDVGPDGPEPLPELEPAPLVVPVAQAGLRRQTATSGWARATSIMKHRSSRDAKFAAGNEVRWGISSTSSRRKVKAE